MFKLLPQKEADKVRHEYKLRRVCVMLGLFCALIIFTGIAILPSIIYAKAKRKAALFDLSSASSVPTPANTTELESEASKLQSELLSLTPDTTTLGPYEYFQKVIVRIPKDVTLTTLSWTKQVATKQLRVDGIAKTRESLLSLQSTLSDSGDWADVSLPVGTIAGDSDIPFEVSLTPQKPK